MDELAQSLEAFGPWDWACVGANLTAAALGLFGLRCWRGLPGVPPPLPASALNAALGVVTGVMAFGLVFGLVVTAAAQAFSSHFGIAQAHVFTAAFLGQAAAALTMIAMGALVPETLRWAPETPAEDPDASPLRRAARAFGWSRLLLVLLILFALGLTLAALWKGVHVGWTQLFQSGWVGEPPADEPQDIVDSVLKTDVDSWRFVTIVFAVTVGAPVMEELAFRGMLYPGLRRLLTVGSERHGRWLAVALTGAIFSAAHLSPSAALPLFGFGAFMCLVRDRYGLLTCMAAHAAFNGWNLVWLKLAPAASTF
ncbi:MAG: CPBP family intramembrane metalloprotease [Verrucomicrobia bacterium]|nr:CPBP family intramembrane metalloprotease [Verrucomicrobiota bacterium]